MAERYGKIFLAWQLSEGQEAGICLYVIGAYSFLLVLIGAIGCRSPVQIRQPRTLVLSWQRAKILMLPLRA